MTSEAKEVSEAAMAEAVRIVAREPQIGAAIARALDAFADTAVQAERERYDAMEDHPTTVDLPPDKELEYRRCVFCGTYYETTNRTRGRKKYCNRCLPQRRYLMSTLAKAKRTGIVLGPWPVFDTQRTDPLTDAELDALTGRKRDDRSCAACGGLFQAATGKQKYCTRGPCKQSRKLLTQQRRTSP